MNIPVFSVLVHSFISLTGHEQSWRLKKKTTTTTWNRRQTEAKTSFLFSAGHTHVQLASWMLENIILLT